MSQNVSQKGSFGQALGSGRLFASGVVDLALAAALDILLRTGAVAPIITFRAAVETSAQVFLFEAPTTSADGASLGSVNLNRGGTPAAAGMVLFTGPTLTDDGAVLGSRYVPAGSGGNAPGGDAESAAPFILRPSTDYLLRLTLVATPGEVDLGMVWSE